MQIMAECKRVLRKDGTMWVNIGDSYCHDRLSSPMKGNYSGTDGVYQRQTDRMGGLVPKRSGMGVQVKSLMGIPERFAIRMTDDLELIRRNTIIWEKPNALPSSAKDRFTVNFEYVYFFTKNRKYWFEQQMEPAAYDGRHDTLYKGGPKDMACGAHERWQEDENGNKVRNKRCVWAISTKPFNEAHFAVYPEELIKPMIAAGCPPDGIVLDPFFGSGTTGVVALKLSRRFIGIELNPEYIKIANKRLEPILSQLKLSI